MLIDCRRFRRPSSNDDPAPDGLLLQGRSFRATVLASKRPWLIQVTQIRECFRCPC